MNTLQVIREQEILSQPFKIYGDFENPLFLAKDVAVWIEYEGRTGQLLKTIDEEEKLMHTIYASGQKRDMWFLTEDGVYEVLMQSRKPIAKRFKKEVKRILKEIRQTGGYGIDTRQLVAEITAEVIKAVIPAVVEIIKQSNQAEQGAGCQPTLTPQMIMQPKQTLKIETFPKEFIRELDDMFFQMKEIEAINYSAISRYCYAKGHPVSNVSIKRYFDRYFRE